MRSGLDRFPHFVTARAGAWLVLALTVVASAAVLALGGPAQVLNDPTAGLPPSAQSTTVARLQQTLPSARITPALAVYSRSGSSLTGADRKAVDGQRTALQRFAVDGQLAPTQVSPDGTVALVAVPLAATVSDTVTTDTVTRLRAVVAAGLPPGLVAQVTGGAAFTADISNAFDGADASLLLTTVAVVAVLLLVTYRSPLLWLVPLAVVGLADQVANALIAVVSRHTSLSFDGAVTGIAEVLVFGAGTDYALLLIARYRDELRVHSDRREAMRRALRAAGPAIAASAVTVVLALLTLLFAVLGNDKAIGIASAVGIATALVFALVVLPAALVACPRGIFWPLVPRVEPDGQRGDVVRGRLWRRIGTATARRPWPVIATASVVLIALATGVLGTTLGLSQVDTFRTRAESVDGLRTLATAFPAGASDPVAILADADAAGAVADAARRVPGVASTRIGETNGAVTEVEAVLASAPNTPASYDAIRRLRGAVAEVPGADAAVGGSVATSLDTRSAAVRDLKVITPLILLVVLAVLIVLLRALVAPVILIATVVVSYFAALGGASLLFTHVLHYPGLDNQVPLLAFLFLVALGVDYNIFLVTRAKEEAAVTDTRRGIVEALAVTGGVITSAGILLAAVFTVLGVLPVTVLTEIGIIVGFGVLLDTLVVRTVLVPAVVQVLGERFWAPGRIRPAIAHPARTSTPHRLPRIEGETG